ncbi:MAG TPA: hypothetical protein VK604_06730 [Bryobacteraceae bacterium]|nr:hypothetical protein [Bryobacteraceae bacterium]
MLHPTYEVIFFWRMRRLTPVLLLSGSEEQTAHLYDTATGRELTEAIERCSAMMFRPTWTSHKG